LVSESIYPPDPALAAWRKAMRAELLARRDAIPLEERRRDDARITGHLLAAFPQLARMTVGFYWPMKGEFDPRVAILRLREQGARAALPVVVKKAAPLEFREWWPGIETVPGVFGLPVRRAHPWCARTPASFRPWDLTKRATAWDTAAAISTAPSPRSRRSRSRSRWHAG
jgi:hypothetical protein